MGLCEIAHAAVGHFDESSADDAYANGLAPDKVLAGR
jgi:hypothetical protein